MVVPSPDDSGCGGRVVKRVLDKRLRARRGVAHKALASFLLPPNSEPERDLLTAKSLWF